MQRYKKLNSKFEALGFEVVIISVDTVKEAAKMKRKMGLRMRVLTDENLAITDLYKIRFNYGLTTSRKLVRPLPIPMKVLIDREGIVRWLETSEDYRVRIAPDEVLEKVRRIMKESGRAAGN